MDFLPHRRPSASRKVIDVFCSEPAKISKVEIINLNVNMIQIKSPIVNKRTGRIMTYSYRDFNLVTTVKDKEGRTFDNTSSLQFRVTLSDPKMGLDGGSLKYPFTFQSGVSSDFKIPLRGGFYISFKLYTVTFYNAFHCYFRNYQDTPPWFSW